MISYSLIQMSHLLQVDYVQQAGKIYVVVGGLVAVFLIIVIYLFLLDRRLRKREKELLTKSN